MKGFTVAAICGGLIALAGVQADASILTLEPGDEVATSDDNTPLDADEIADLTGFEGILELLYKAEVGTLVSEEGPFADFYTTVFSNTATDPEDSDITWDGPVFMTEAEFLVVKDGNADPAQYIFSLDGWDGMMDIELRNFWPDQGAISHVALWGGPGNEIVPEPMALVVWSGLALLGLAYGYRVRSRKTVLG